MMPIQKNRKTMSLVHCFAIFYMNQRIRSCIDALSLRFCVII